MKFIRPTLTLLAAAALLAIPSRSEAALVFDLNATPEYGYDTKPVVESVGGLNSFEAIGAGAAVNGATSTLTGNGTALISTYSGTTPFDPFGPPPSASERYADITITNSNASGTLTLNELRIAYTFTQQNMGSSFGGINVYWMGPTMGTYQNMGALSTSSGVFSFQGEDLYTLTGGANGAPLLGSNESGILRFVFVQVGVASNASQTLQISSITAVVPEPSSTLLLTSALGLFGGFFRRRRRLAPVES